MLRRQGMAIVTIRQEEPVASAVRRLKTAGVGALVVTDTGKAGAGIEDGDGDDLRAVPGILSERDIVRALADHGAAALAMPVSAFLTRPVVVCGPRDDLRRVLGLMDRHHLRHLPVVADGRLIGVIGIGDIIRRQLDEFEEEAVAFGPLQAVC